MNGTASLDSAGSRSSNNTSDPTSNISARAKPSQAESSSASTAPTHSPTSPRSPATEFPLPKIKDVIQQSNRLLLDECKPSDVDWFLRDSVQPHSLVVEPVSSSAQTDQASSSAVHLSPSSHGPTDSVAPSLMTTISNSRSAIPNKARESVSVSSSESDSVEFASPGRRRRSNLVSNSSAAPPRSGGFFSKLKGKLSLKTHEVDQAPVRKLEPSKVSPRPSEPKDQFPLSRSMSNPSPGSRDPRLAEYIKFYEQKPTHKTLVDDDGSVSRNLGKLSSFLRHRSSSPPREETYIHTYENSHIRRASVGSISSRESSHSPDTANSVPPSLRKLKPLRRVAFHLSTFLIDPPQQIPSRTPRCGNVEVQPSGDVVIRPLTAEERIAVEESQMGRGGGVVVGGTGSLQAVQNVSDHESDDENNSDDTEPPSEASEPAIDEHARALQIDKPMITHRCQGPPAVKKMALDLMYTRCCHLREILPVPAILKQIPAGSMDPLPILQFRNPVPTQIEVQSFADFIRIAPIICVSLDGVSFTLSQFKTLLSAMSAKKQLEKLSLRNTPIDSDGWSLLCWFLSRNTVMNRLDITQCPSLSVNVLKRKTKKGGEPKPDEEGYLRMKCNKENRSDMDWSLFVATLVARGGIDELILTGCRIIDVDVFELLVEMALLIRTSRLGLAYNQLTPRHLEIVVDYWLLLEHARGLDLGYNDFLSSSMHSVLLSALQKKGLGDILPKCNLTFLSMNSTNSRFSGLFKLVFEQFIMKLPNLRYLDFSNNPRLFCGSSLTGSDSPTTPTEAAIAEYFTLKLPMFPSLTRLHLENNNFSQELLIAIAKILPFCNTLSYISLLGNPINLTTASVLIEGLKSSRSLVTLDCDYEGLPEFFKEKIGLYTMRNMERLLYSHETQDKAGLEDAIDNNPDSLTEQLNTLLELKAKQELDMDSSVVRRFVAKAGAIRLNLKRTINELLTLQLRNELNLDGKETLMRFIFIDSCVEKGLQLIDPTLDTETLTAFILRGASEDEKNRYAEKPTEDDQPETSHLPATAPMSKSTSRTSLTQLDRQEGSMLKLLRLHDFHCKVGVSETEKNLIFGPLSQLLGEDIRQKLKEADLGDLDKVVSYLQTLKDRGVLMENVFTLHDPNLSHEVESDELTLENLLNRLKKLTEKHGEPDNTANQSPKSPPIDLQVTSGIHLPDPAAMTTEDQTHDVIETYNKVFEKYADSK